MNKQTLFTRLMVLVLWLLGSPAWGAERTTYYHLDLLGSPVAASDRTGQVRWREEYKPYGERLLKPGASSGHTLWYTGKVHDDAVGLSYYGVRWHDPELGRFTGIDPVDVQEGNVQSFNRYAYANNNPYKYVDPDGRVGFLAPLLVFIGKEAGSEAVEQVTGVPLPTVKNAVKTTAKIAKKAAAKGTAQKLLPAPEQRPSVPTNGRSPNAPDSIAVDSRGNAIPLKQGERLTASPDGRWIQVRDANGNPTGVRIDGPHSPKTHTDPRALQPHGHIPGRTNPDGTPWLPINQ